MEHWTRGRRFAGWTQGLLGFMVLATLFQPAPVAAQDRPVTALGRLEPLGGVIHVAGPSRPGSVIAELKVDEGDDVREGDVLAVLDTLPEAQARVARLSAERADAQAKLAREETLRREGATSKANYDTASLGVDVAEAEVAAAAAALEMSVVRAPIQGRVLEIHANRGERIGPAGLLELGQVSKMEAVAEVYETDIGRVRLGQKASISSPALSAPLTGRVRRVGQKVGKLDVLGTDPTAATDARVVEVDIALDDSAEAEALTNLTVEVRIDTSAP